MDKYIHFKNNNPFREKKEYFIENCRPNSSWINSNYEIGIDHVIEAISNVAEPRGATTRDVVAWIRANYARRAPFIVVKVKRALNHAIRERRVELVAGRYKIIDTKSISSQQTSNATAKFINCDSNSQRASTCVNEMNKNPIKDFLNCYKLPSPSRLGLIKRFQNNYKHLRRPRTSHVAVQCVLWRRQDPKEKKDFINKNFDWDSSTISEETKPPR